MNCYGGYQSIKASTLILFDWDCEVSAPAAEGIEVDPSPSSLEARSGERGRLRDSVPE
jgi:hypothetical protein